MLTGIAFLIALGAVPAPDPSPTLHLPMLRLALLEKSPSSTPVEQWPIEPAKAQKPGAQKSTQKLNLVAPIVLASVGASLAGLGALGVGLVSQSCRGNSNPDAAIAAIFVCVPAILGFGSIGVLGGAVFLAGAIWLVVDLVIHASSYTEYKPFERSHDSDQGPPRTPLLVRF